MSRPENGTYTSRLETTLGLRLRVAAAVLGLDDYEMAELVGTDAKTMGKWIRDITRPREMERLLPLAEKLGLPLSALVTGAGFLSIEGVGARRPPYGGQSSPATSARVREAVGDTGMTRFGYGVSQISAHEFARRLFDDPGSVTKQLDAQLAAGVTVEDVLAWIDDAEDELHQAGYAGFQRWLGRERDRLRGRGGQATGA